MDKVNQNKRNAMFLNRQKQFESKLGDFKMKCFATSIWEPTLYKAWSAIVRSIVPNLEKIKELLGKYSTACKADEIALFEKNTFLNISYFSSIYIKNDERIEKICAEMKKFKNSCKIDSKKFNQAKNLTESLSKSQKILLLASYFASEISAKNDKMFFKAKKSKGAKKAKRKNNTFLGHNLKSNFGNPFNIHRLIAIYQSLLSSCEINFQDDDIMVKCEITSLEKLGLIKNISGIDSRTMDQKYITKINLELARKIAEDFDIRLEDYIKVESLD